MLASRLGALVKERRMLRQLTQNELACLAGVSRAVVMRLERPGGASVGIDSAERVLRALGMRLRMAGDIERSRRDWRDGVVLLH
jgi:transcriptional regulator with XRE-family HTH domain